MMILPIRSGGSQHKLPRIASCPVTLVTDDLTGSGASAAQVDGQRTFIDNVSNTDRYMATTDLDNPKSMWSGSTKWIEAQNVTSSDGVGAAGVGFVAADFSKAFYVVYQSDSTLQTWEYIIEQPIGAANEVANDAVSGSINDDVAIGIDGDTGDCRLVINGSEISLGVDFNGFWANESIGLIGIHDSNPLSGTPRSTSCLLVTQANNYNTDFSSISGTNTDWCENSL